MRPTAAAAIGTIAKNGFLNRPSFVLDALARCSGKYPPYQDFLQLLTYARGARFVNPPDAEGGRLDTGETMFPP
jgi:hypothetical protein